METATMVTGDRYFVLGELVDGVDAVLQLDGKGGGIQCPAVWDAKARLYRHNRTGKTLSMYAADQLGPQLRGAGIKFTERSR